MVTTARETEQRALPPILPLTQKWHGKKKKILKFPKCWVYSVLTMTWNKLSPLSAFSPYAVVHIHNVNMNADSFY